MLASTFKSEKSFEVSSTSLRHSVVSSVARLQNSNPTTTKKITLRRILESDNTGELYSKRMLNSTAMRRADIPTRDTAWHGGAKTGTFGESGCAPALSQEQDTSWNQVGIATIEEGARQATHSRRTSVDIVRGCIAFGQY